MNATRKIRWAILGAGKIAHKFAQDFSVVHNAEIVAVAARDVGRAQAFATQYNIPQALTYSELYDSSLVDVVYIATTHNFHFEQSITCMQHGKAVLCEKPVTLNDMQLEELAIVARENGVFFMEAMWTYFLPAIQKAIQWVGAGTIGAIQTIHADFCYPMEFNPASRLFDPMLAGGALLDLGIYPIALATLFMNRKPDTISASALMSSTHVDASTSMILQYGPATAFLVSSMVSKSLNKAVIIGEKGHIEIPDFFKAFAAHLYNDAGQKVESFQDDRKTWGYHHEIQEVTDCILDGKLESRTMPVAKSMELQQIMTEVRKQIGFSYPMENAIL